MTNLTDPEQLADKLPSRPLSPEEVADISRALDLSVMKTTYETQNGTEYVPAFYAFEATEEREDMDDNPAGRAYALRMDDEMDQWSGSIEASDVTESQWTQVCEETATALGGERELEAVTVKTSEGTQTRELE